jgi:drug/metabolite transporter (DMT)-like permease
VRPQAIANAVEVVFTAIFSFMLFGTDLGLLTVASCVVVALGLYCFSTKAKARAASAVEPPAMESQA